MVAGTAAETGIAGSAAAAISNLWRLAATRSVRPACQGISGQPLRRSHLAGRDRPKPKRTGCEIERRYVDKGYRGHHKLNRATRNRSRSDSTCAERKRGDANDPEWTGGVVAQIEEALLSSNFGYHSPADWHGHVASGARERHLGMPGTARQMMVPELASQFSGDTEDRLFKLDRFLPGSATRIRQPESGSPDH